MSMLNENTPQRDGSGKDRSMNQGRAISFATALFAIGAGLAGGPILPGCVESNSRNQIGDDVTLSAFQPAKQVVSSEDTQRTDDPASLTSLDRSAWEPVVFALPVDGVRHRPEYRFLAGNGTDTLRRQRGEYPTAASALELDGGARASHQRFFESITEPIHAGLELVRLPFIFALQSPWSETWSPLGSYDRVKNHGERPETMANLRDPNMPRAMTPAYEDDSLFVPGDPAREGDNSNKPPATEEGGVSTPAAAEQPGS